MPIIRAPRPERNFYMLDKAISQDKRLSWAARGLLIFLLGKPDNWRVSVPALINETAGAAKSTGRDAVYTLLNELIAAGYVRRDKHPDGSIDYTVCEPDPENPDVAKKPLPENPDPENPDPENPDAILSTDQAVRIEEKPSTEASLEIAPAAPKAKTRKGSKVPLQTFLDDCKAKGESAIPEGDPIFGWAEKAKVPVEMLELCWRVFKDKFQGDASKKQIDWRAHFRNAVKGSWYRLWGFDRATGECYLTTVGEQARRVHDTALALSAHPPLRSSRAQPTQAQLDATNAQAKELLFGKSTPAARPGLWPTQQEGEANVAAWLAASVADGNTINTEQP